MVANDKNNSKFDGKNSKIFCNKDIHLSPKIMRMKKIVVEKDFDIHLTVSIDFADGIDELTTSISAATLRFYKILFWVHPDEQYSTREVFGDPNPVWKQRFKILLNKLRDYRFLHVEVLRFDSIDDPGTSDGVVLVGRAQIPLPTFEANKKGGRFGLVRLYEDGYKPEGHVTLSMTLEKWVYE